MNFLRTTWSKLRSLGQQRTVKREIDEELRFHVEMREQENIRAGMSPEKAHQEALKRFGNVQTVREECRDLRGANFGETILQDVRFGARMLRKNPGFTAIAILTLALGIGANTAIFSFINAILLQPLPYQEPERIVTSRSNQNISPAEFFAWQKEGRALDDIAVYSFVFYSMPGNPDPERVKGVRSSPALLSVFKVNPYLGRDFREEEVFRGAERVIMLGYDLWKRRFNGDKDLVGKAVSIGGETLTLIGIAPPGFNFPDGSEFWTPSEFALGEKIKGLEHLPPKNSYTRSLRSVARLKPGITLRQANVEMDVITARLVPEQAKDGSMPVARFTPLQEDMVGKVRPGLLLLLGAVGLVLLVACANVANLLLARAVTRQKEIALRCALGAGPRRIFQQLLSESVLLSVLGGLAGLFLAVWLAKFFLLIAPPNIPRLQEVRIDGTVLVFSLIVAVLCGILFGLLPAFQAVRINLLKTLNDGGKGVRGGVSQRARNILVIAEIAIAIVLLTGAGLLVQSLARLQRVDPGFNAKNLIMVPMAGMCGFRWELLERVRALPGDYSIAVVDFAPGGGLPGMTGFRFANESPETGRNVRVNLCSADYFKTMGIPILRGREFERYEHRKNPGDPDSGLGPLVAVVNDVFVQRYLPDEEPLEKRIYLPGARGTNVLTIIGVAKANRYSPAYPPEPEVFTLFPQQCGSRPLMLMIRSQADLRNVMAAVRKEARMVDNNVAVGDGMTMETQMSRLLAQQRFQMTLLVGLAVTALVLAAVGIYGVLAYTVTQRTQEIGVRMALGAQRSDVLWLVLRQGMKLAFIGVGIGIIAAIGLSRFIKSFLFGVTPTDPLTFFAITVLLLAIALVACWLPARRATRVEPMVALRCE